MFSRSMVILLMCLTLGFGGISFAADMPDESLKDFIGRLHHSAEMATRAESLEGLQEQARKIMELAGAFQQQAQAVNDMGYVNEAIDIYNSAFRASKSSSLEEARGYARQVVSHTGVVVDQSGLSHHDPNFYMDRQYEDLNEHVDQTVYEHLYRNSNVYPEVYYDQRM